MAVTQALLQAEGSAKKGNIHATVLNLEKACDNVYREPLLETVSVWVDGETTKMVRSMLGPIHIRAKQDPTNYSAVITWGVPQGAPTSPFLFNMYIDHLLT